MAEWVNQDFKESNRGRYNLKLAFIDRFKEWLYNIQIARMLFDKVDQWTGVQSGFFSLEVI
jgi:hypothetical protein